MWEICQRNSKSTSLRDGRVRKIRENLETTRKILPLEKFNEKKNNYNFKIRRQLHDQLEVSQSRTKKSQRKILGKHASVKKSKDFPAIKSHTVSIVNSNRPVVLRWKIKVFELPAAASFWYRNSLAFWRAISQWYKFWN